MYQIGDVLSVPKLTFRHFMIVVAPGVVVHASKDKGCVVREHIQDAAKNRTITSHGRWASISNEEILARAKNLVGRPYKLFSGNCEHLVREISGVKRASPQLVTAVAVLGLAACLIWGRNRTA